MGIAMDPRRAFVPFVFLLCAACADHVAAASGPPAESGAAAHPPAPPSHHAEPAPEPASGLAYPWLGDRAVMPAAVDSLEQRFAPPAGFVRASLPRGSFGGWLRRLPLAAPETPVTSYRGGVILPADHDNLAAVVAIDVGAGDLQQCADSILRLHAEWLYAQGRRDQSYRAASGAVMPFARWARGDRMKQVGAGFVWVAGAARADDGRASFRRWLDGVFAWANTGSLARDTEVIAPEDLRPGDFVVQPGGPGHAVLVLDLARGPGGRRALLLGQGFMPAQSFQVLRPSARAGVWFIVEPGATALTTPFWAPFPWKALRRFPGT